MADILISRQDYSDAQDQSELNGWKPNISSGAITATTIAASGTADIPADFKDHKTVFVAVAEADAVITVKAGDSYQGVNDVEINAPEGTSVFWLDSAKFVDQKTGKITVTVDKAVDIFGYEMR